MPKASQLVETQSFAERLHLSPDELRYGTLTSIFKAQDSEADLSVLAMQERKTVCGVVVALSVAVSVKVRQ